MITTTATAAAAAADTASSASYNDITRGKCHLFLFSSSAHGRFLTQHSILSWQTPISDLRWASFIPFVGWYVSLVQPRIYVSSRQNILFSTLGFHRNEYSEFAMNFTGVIHTSVCSACKSYQPIRVLMKFIQNKCTRFYLLYRLM